MAQNNEVDKALDGASRAPTVKTEEARERETADRRLHEHESKPVSVNKTSHLTMIKGTDDPHQLNDKSQTLGPTAPETAENAHGFEDIKKSEEDDDDDSSSLAASFSAGQDNLKKDLNSLPKVAAQQVPEKKGPMYDSQDTATVVKSVNLDRLKLAWDLNKIAKAGPEDLRKNDPIKKEYGFKGIDICIEWEKGSIRQYKEDGEMKDGKRMKADYGYFKDTTSEDKEELDCYVGTNHKSNKVFLLMQKPTPWDIEHGMDSPEEKYMLGFNSKEEAKNAYLGSMPSKWFDSITDIDWDAFTERLSDAKIKKPKFKALKKSLAELSRMEERLIPKLVIKI